MAARKSTKKPARKPVAKIEDMSGDWLEEALKRKRHENENIHDLVVEILREVRAVRREIKSRRCDITRSLTGSPFGHMTCDEAVAQSVMST